MSSPRRLLLALTLACAAAACRRPATLPPAVDALAWDTVPPADLRGDRPLGDARLRESSGIAASRAHAGVLWTLNDSGNDPLLFAADTSGRVLGALRVTGARNVDWEEIARGPCRLPRGADCLTIFDIGDNNESRENIALYRVREPAPGDTATDRVERLRLRYPDGPHDIEAGWVDARGDTWLVTKGRTAGVLLFRVPESAWTDGAAVAEARQRLPIDPAPRRGGLLTGAALSPDGRTAIVRSYATLYRFGVAPDGTLVPEGRACSVRGMEPQGEAVTWLDDRTLVLTSEAGWGKPAALTLLRCPGVRDTP